MSDVSIPKWRGVEWLEKCTYPASPLFQMGRERIRQQSVLYGLVDIHGFPAGPEHQTRGEHIFGKGVGGEPSDVLKCPSAHHVARSGAPRNPKQILQGFHKAKEGYKGLLKRIICRNIVVQLPLLATRIPMDV
jgi:hypothetical protein